VNGQPYNVQRLPNGHTLIANNFQIVEVDRAGKDVLTINNLGQLTSAFKLRNGQIMCMTQNGQCHRLDASGKILKTFNTNRGNPWMSLLPNGHVVVAQNGGNKVSEFDAEGKMLLDLDIPQVTTATGLPNGHILLACHNTGRVIEIDRRGQVLWEYKTQFPFRARGR
jgi:hypothetical protein